MTTESDNRATAVKSEGAREHLRQFAQVVRTRRETLSLSLREVATMTDGAITHDTVMRIERGEDVRLSSAVAVVRALGIPSATIFRKNLAAQD